MKLLESLEEFRKVRAATLAERQKKVIEKRRHAQNLKEVEKDSKLLQPEVGATSDLEDGDEGSRYGPERYNWRKGLSMETMEKRRRASQSQSCEICHKTAKDADELVTCVECFTLAHFTCFGLTQLPGDGFECEECAQLKAHKGNRARVKSKSTLRDEDEYQEEESEEEANDADSASDSDDENLSHTLSDSDLSEQWEEDIDLDKVLKSGSSIDQVREQRLAATEEAIFLRSLELQDFCDEKQPDDAERHKLALLQIPKGKMWQDSDLENENNLRIGLHVLYNRIQGKEELHFGKSIHIRYLAFTKDCIEKMEKRRAVHPARERAAKERGLN
jgi:hypothetical protein